MRRRLLSWLFGVVALILVSGLIAGIGIHENWIRLAPRWAPWGAPDLRTEPGWFARLQLNSIAADGRTCFRVLSQARVSYRRRADRRFDQACGYTDVVASKPPIAFHPALTATCSLTAALDWYQRTLSDLARRTLHARIVGIDHVGTYVCRNINWERNGMRSQHATANAIDIAAFQLSDGRIISVARDWKKPTPEGRFLHDAHNAACDLFNVVLGPDYNRAHATHFHLDLGPFRTCR